MAKGNSPLPLDFTAKGANIGVNGSNSKTGQFSKKKESQAFKTAAMRRLKKKHELSPNNAKHAGHMVKPPKGKAMGFPPVSKLAANRRLSRSIQATQQLYPPSN